MAITKFTKKEETFTNKEEGGMGAYGTPKRREELPGSYFLMPKERKFPYKTSDGKISRRLLIAAIHRAAQYGYKDVESKAREILNREFGSESKKLYQVPKEAIK